MKKSKLWAFEKTLAVDVDETLVLFKYPPELEGQAVEFNAFGFPYRVVPHYKHIDAIKQFKARGHGVIVWSAGGGKWAEAVVKFLGLEEHVDLIMTKVDWAIDDKKDIRDWGPEVFYLKPDGADLLMPGDIEKVVLDESKKIE